MGWGGGSPTTGGKLECARGYSGPMEEEAMSVGCSTVRWTVEQEKEGQSRRSPGRSNQKYACQKK